MSAFRTAIAVVALLGVSGGLAAPAGNENLPTRAYRAMGTGTGSCGGWTDARSRTDSLVANDKEQWVLGFLSGIGFMGSSGYDPLNGMDPDGVWGWIDNYCRANPIESISRAARQFFYTHPR